MKKPLFIVIATLVSLNASAQYSDTIHLENNHGHFYFNATINDSIDGRFLFDTGAGAALFDVNFLQSVYTPQVVHPVTMNGMGNKVVEAYYTPDTLKMTFGAVSTLIDFTVLVNFGTIIAPDYRGYFLAPNFEDQMVINGLIENYKGALKMGDVVTHIDGKSLDKMSYKEHKSYCSTPDLTHTITIIRQGSPLTITTTNLNNTTLWQ